MAKNRPATSPCGCVTATAAPSLNSLQFAEP
jgi:hypothetical protein